MSKNKKQSIVKRIEVQIPEYPFPKKLRFLVPVHNRTTPLFIYKRSVKSINTDIKALKKDIWRARLLKMQAYIAYRLTK